MTPSRDEAIIEREAAEARPVSAPLAESSGDEDAPAPRLWAARLVLATVILGLWEAIGGRWVDLFWMSKPSLIIKDLIVQVRTGEIVVHLAATLEEMAIGLVVGGGVGVFLGLVLGRRRVLADVLNPFIIALYSLPKVALAPLFILWFGIDLLSKVILVAVIVAFLVFFNTYSGVREVNPNLLNVLRVMGATNQEIFRQVILPSAGSWILTGFRIAVPYALIGAVVGELMASSKGIGYRLTYAAQMFDTTRVFTALLVLMLVAAVLNEVVTRIEAWALRWKAKG
ncbi:MAG: ABC transporter permease [Candidatus Rokubacteria bacterium]|nr:ABC transporter permease [Candidatus Rokubacteria bacterium]